MKTEKLPVYTLLTGIILLIISILIPYNSLEFILGEGLRPAGLVTIYINPILGIIGIASSIHRRKWALAILNILLIFSFFIVMAIGYGILGA